MNLRRVFIITKFSFAEVRQARVWLLALATVLGGLALAEFAAALAITESNEYRIVVYAAATRFVGALIVTLYVASSVLREFDDKNVELILSRPITRTDWYIGRFLGLAAISCGIAVILASPLAILASGAALLWTYSLALEMLIVAAATMAACVSLRQLPLATCAVVGFYFLARSVSNIALMSTGPTVDAASTANRFIALAVELIAYVVPALDRFTQSSWLLDGASALSELGFISLQTIIFVVLLSGIGLFDLHRRNF